jgi:hypothetical protein
MDDLIQAATYRFRPDAELQAEIARELRVHLEDSFAAARAGGMDEAQAEEAACRAFGDPQEVGEKLWQANRRRMRLRAVAKWSGRLLLMPAGILLALWLCGATLEVLSCLWIAGTLSGNGRRLVSVPRPAPWIEHLYTGSPLRSDLNDEQRMLLEANESDREEWERAAPEPPQEWERFIAHYPSNPVYRAHYFTLFSAFDLRDEAPLLPSHRPLFDRALAILDAGEKADPDNAFWNYMKADILMYKSGAADQKEDPEFTYSAPAGAYRPATSHGMKLVFTDRPMFERGLAEYRKGLPKPIYRSYAWQFDDELLNLRNSPRTLLDELQVIMEWEGTLLPDLAIMRNMTRGIMAYAALRIHEDHPQQAEELIRTAPIAGAQIGANSRSVIDLLLADAMRQIALRQGAALYERLGKSEQAAEALALARKESPQEGAFLQMTPAAEGEERKFLSERAGLLGRAWFGVIPFSDRSITVSLARAERFLLERAALGVLALLYLIVVGWMGIWTIWHLWRHRKDARGPKLYFIGWRRLGWIVLIAVALPLLAYVLLTRAFAFGSAHYGINYQPVRVALEISGTMALILGLSLYLAVRASRACCRAAGITDRKEVWMSVRRSMLPVLVACSLAVGVGSQAYLRYGESSAVRSLNQPGRRILLDEVEYVKWKDYRAYLRALPDHGALPPVEGR